MRTNTVPSCYVSYPLYYFFGMVDEELAVVHAREDFDVCLRAEGKQVFHLRFGDEGSSGAASRMAWLMISSSRSKTRERILPQ